MVATSNQSKGVRTLIPTSDQPLTQGDLIDFKNEMLSEFKRIIKESMGEPGKRWLKSCEVKKMLGISHGFLQTLRDSGTLPFSKIGGSIYYDFEDICQMMSSKKSDSKPGSNLHN
ncbi:MAG: helix-turn-helix domain-containing protein [Bacteroidetes bacterium]|nr:helix-turn-helix domain-containing protein [Bacteroidota bacterium]MBU1484838.1 helix-turn-helix domain-containing protein [Bacteroidota bacterium]MBU2269520.1 helix-turn-helix domain-containing protein [Bacteroidota bacterium]MBU2376193.1 helix-turn-helix domain-containing protein [Bacteroidota bacterium]